MFSKAGPLRATNCASLSMMFRTSGSDGGDGAEEAPESISPGKSVHFSEKLILDCLFGNVCKVSAAAGIAALSQVNNSGFRNLEIA